MRKSVFTIGAVVALSGCMQGPQSPDEVRSAVNGGAMFSQKSTVMVPRSHAAVTASLQAGAKQCLNRTQRRTSTTPGPYGPQVSSYTTAYRGEVKTGGGRTELSIYHEVLGSGFLPQPKGYAYVVDATPATGGTRLDIYGGRFGNGDLNKAVVAWAKTGQIRCPELPG